MMKKIKRYSQAFKHQVAGDQPIADRWMLKAKCAQRPNVQPATCNLEPPVVPNLSPYCGSASIPSVFDRE